MVPRHMPGRALAVGYRLYDEGWSTPGVSLTMAVGRVAGARRDALRPPGRRPLVRGTVIRGPAGQGPVVRGRAVRAERPRQGGRTGPVSQTIREERDASASHHR